MEEAKTDWLRNVLRFIFFLLFMLIMYVKLSELEAMNTQMSETKRSSKLLMFPSVTVCPVLLSEVIDRKAQESRVDALSAYSDWKVCCIIAFWPSFVVILQF